MSDSYTLRIVYYEADGIRRVYLSTWSWSPSRSEAADVVRRLRDRSGEIDIRLVQIIKKTTINLEL